MPNTHIVKNFRKTFHGPIKSEALKRPPTSCAICSDDVGAYEGSQNGQRKENSRYVDAKTFAARFRQNDHHGK